MLVDGRGLRLRLPQVCVMSAKPRMAGLFYFTLWRVWKEKGGLYGNVCVSLTRCSRPIMSHDDSSHSTLMCVLWRPPVPSLKPLTGDEKGEAGG